MTDMTRKWQEEANRLRRLTEMDGQYIHRLEDENRRLRERLDRLQVHQAIHTSPPPPPGALTTRIVDGPALSDCPGKPVHTYMDGACMHCGKPSAPVPSGTLSHDEIVRGICPEFDEEVE